MTAAPPDPAGETAAVVAGLNPPQLAAVTADDGPLLILAGAGSGKTRVLTHRIAYLVATGRVRPHEVLAVTFTNKAAREMRERLARLLGGEPPGLWLGTFHAIAARLLRRDGEAIGVPPDFAIYDEGDRQAALRRALQQVGAQERLVSPAAAAAAISHAKNEQQGQEAYARLARTPFELQVARAWPIYTQLLADSRALDFDDLLLRAVQLLEEAREVADRYQERFRQVLVDEYQDTNRAQYRIVRALAARHGHLTVVGDPDQSIYAWRGADLRNILSFEQDYPRAQVVALEQNYRSTARILEAAEAVIAANTERVAKRLWTEAADGAQVTVAQLYDEREEATAVAREARRLVDHEGASLGEIAVLYRTNAQSRALEEVLLRHGIPYQLVGGVRFYQRREIKDGLAYLRLLVNPDDEMAFDRVVNVPKRGIGPQSLEALLAVAREAGCSRMAAIPLAAVDRVRGPAAVALRHFRDTVAELRAWAPGWPLPTVIDRVVQATGYRQLIQDGTPEGEERWSNLLELRGLADEFRGQPVRDALPAFLEQVALAGDVDTLDEGRPGLTLITLHQVKGLEFPIVFITGLEEGLLPHSRSRDEAAALEEERRLLYVGMTRAMRRLYLFHAFRRHLYGSPTLATPSRFLAPLPATVRRLATSVGGPGPAPGWAPGLTEVSGRLTARDAVIARAVAPAAAATPVALYRAGERVEHVRYGAGTILKSTLTRAGEEVVIQFDRAGARIFAVDDAVLRRLDR